MYIKFNNKIEANPHEYTKMLNSIIDGGSAFLYPRVSGKSDKTGFTLQALNRRYETADDICSTSLVLFRINSRIDVPNYLEARGMGRFNSIFDAACNAVGFFTAMGVTSYFPSVGQKMRSNGVIADQQQVLALNYDIYMLDDMKDIRVPVLRI